ncbi:hypothetical protein I4U23_023572 [Adineta vaga]|nr:hypothetical protein I4U23_023572 [Adineta vaga]
MTTRNDSTTKIAALGRSFKPGMLYDYRTDRLIPNIFLWGNDLIPMNISCQNLSMSRCTVHLRDTFTENANFLGIDDNLKMSIVAELVDLVGASKLLENRKTTNRTVRYIVKQSITTDLRSLTMGYSSKQYTKHPDIFDQQIATHVVTDVLYGVELIFIFERSISDDEDATYIQENIKHLLEKIPSFHFTSNDQLNWKDYERRLAETLTCQYCGDFQLRSDPTTFEQVVRLHKQLPELLGENNRNAIPQQVSLYALYLLDDLRLTEKRFSHINIRILSKSLELIDALHRFEIILNDLKHKFLAVRFFEKSIQQLSTSKNQFFEYETKIKRQLIDLLPNIRNGSMEETKLIKLLSIVDLSPEEKEKFDDWIRFKTKEARILASLLDDLRKQRNINLFTGSFREIEKKSKGQVLFRLIIHVTERKDRFLNELFRSFDNNSTQRNAQIDCWYNQDNLTLIRKHLDRFIQVANNNQNRQNIEFLVNEQYAGEFPMKKGITTVLYRNGTPIDFEYPSQPGRPQVTDISGLNVTLHWSAPVHGNQTIEHYKVYGRNISNRQWQLLARTKDATGSTVISNLTDGKYEFKVQGMTVINETDESDVSDVVKVTTPRPISPVSIVKSPPAIPQVTTKEITKNKATIDVTPAWFEEVKSVPLEKTRLPSSFNKNSPVEVRTYQCLANFRSMNEKTQNIDFVAKPFEADVENTETLVVVLNELVTQLGARLTFTNSEFTYDDSDYRTACGVINLGSIHTFLASEGQFQTAKFTLHLDLDYDQLTATPETLKKFVLSSINDIASIAGCNKDFIRVFDIRRAASILFAFGLTTAKYEDFVDTAELLKSRLNDNSKKSQGGIREYIIDECEYEIEAALVTLQIQQKDLEPIYNRKYTYDHEEIRGGRPYYLPNGWYRHALRVIDKYPEDKLWLGMDNSPGEWAVAYHGTTCNAVRSIVDEGLLHRFFTRDAFKYEAKQQNPSIPDVNGIYVATHCEGGASLYAISFNVKESTGIEKTLQVVFQCRVEPGKFTEHENTKVVNVGNVWRAFDEKAIRPYGLLLKSS